VWEKCGSGAGSSVGEWEHVGRPRKKGPDRSPATEAANMCDPLPLRVDSDMFGRKFQPVPAIRFRLDKGSNFLSVARSGRKGLSKLANDIAGRS
jgi:hypothetical protein